MTEVKLKHCRIVPAKWGCTTFFEDGSETSNWPQLGADFEEVAAACGSASKVSYIREHDLCHALLAEKMFDRPSEVLWRSAHGISSHLSCGDWEEKLVFYFQRFIHQRARAPEPMWVLWKDEALHMARTLNSIKERG